MGERKQRTRNGKRNKEALGNRLALLGITMVVVSMGVLMGIKVHSMKAQEEEYRIRQENLESQYADESRRAEELEEYRVYVQTKQYIEKVAKEKLGLVRPGEILLKPSDGE